MLSTSSGSAPAPPWRAAAWLFLPAIPGLVAPFLPWLTFTSRRGPVVLNGIGGNSDTAEADLGATTNTAGIVAVLLASVLMATALLVMVHVIGVRAASIVGAAIGAMMLVVGGSQFVTATRAVAAGGPASGHVVTVGAGVWLTILSGVLALLAAAFVAKRT